MKTRWLAITAAAAFLAAGSVPAATLDYTADFTAGVGAEWSTSGSDNTTGVVGRFSGGYGDLNIDAPGTGTGRLTFDLLGFASVDGYNCCTDVFRLTANGTEVFRGVFNLGGGGAEGIELQPAGTSVTGAGSARTIALDVSLLNGANTFRFDYGPMQGYGDEAWAVDNVSLYADSLTPAVPEPATYALMLAGLALIGYGVRNRRA